MTAISFLIGVLMVVVVRAICFVLIERFVRDARLANLLKLLLCSMLGRHCAETSGAHLLNTPFFRCLSQSNRNASANRARDTMPPAMIATSKMICPTRPRPYSFQEYELESRDVSNEAARRNRQVTRVQPTCRGRKTIPGGGLWTHCLIENVSEGFRADDWGSATESDRWRQWRAGSAWAHGAKCWRRWRSATVRQGELRKGASLMS